MRLALGNLRGWTLGRARAGQPKTVTPGGLLPLPVTSFIQAGSHANLISTACGRPLGQEGANSSLGAPRPCNSWPWGSHSCNPQPSTSEEGRLHRIFQRQLRSQGFLSCTGVQGKAFAMKMILSNNCMKSVHSLF